ncbi:hypothetical protein H7097_00450 [Aeromicrobium sp.]|nr:hypothetical protein [Candidatus Saccharibacteria bacterium]
MSKNHERIAKATYAIKSREKNAAQAAIQNTLKAAELEKERRHKVARQLPIETTRTIEELEAAGFPGARMIDFTIKKKPWGQSKVQEPGWMLFMVDSGVPDNESQQSYYETRSYLLAAGDFMIEISTYGGYTYHPTNYYRYSAEELSNTLHLHLHLAEFVLEKVIGLRDEI